MIPMATPVQIVRKKIADGRGRRQRPKGAGPLLLQGRRSRRQSGQLSQPLFFSQHESVIPICHHLHNHLHAPGYAGNAAIYGRESV